jgi:hypothetical protein
MMMMMIYHDNTKQQNNFIWNIAQHKHTNMLSSLAEFNANQQNI